MKQATNPSNLYSKDTLNKYFCYSIALLFILAPLISNSQTCDDYWVSTLPANGSDSKPVIDNAGFLYQVGRNREGSANIPGITVAKYSQGGDIQWSKEFAGTFAGFRLRVTVFDDNLYLGGSYRSADFQDGNGTILSTEDENDPFILKMDTAGNVIALQTFPGTGRDEFLGFNHDSEGNLYFSGSFRQHLVLPNTNTLGLTASTNVNDTWVALIKLDNNLNLIWSKISNLTSTGGNQQARGFEIITDDLDNIYMGGYFSYELTFGDGPIVNSNVRGNPYVAKFDKNGNNLWIHGTKTIDDIISTVYALTLDATKNVYYAGYFSNINVGGIDYTSNGSVDTYLGKLNSDGTPAWFNQIGTSEGSFEWPGVVDFDSNGDLYMVAVANTETDGVVILDSDLNSMDFGTDLEFTVYIAKYNPINGLLLDVHTALYQDFIGRGGIIFGDQIFRSGSTAFLVGELLSGQNIELFRLPDFEIEGFSSILAGDSVRLNAIAPNAVSYQWFLEDVLIPGATDSVFYAKEQGAYDIEIISTVGCTLKSVKRVGTNNIIILQPGNVYTVNSTDDLGDINPGDGFCLDNLSNCTLRAAIEEANATTGTVDTIKFNISGVGPHTIQPNSGLPIITDPLVIDGTTEPDFVNTPIVEIDGSAAGSNVFGFQITTGNSMIKGLVINRFGSHGVFINGSSAIGNRVQGNFIGTDVTGTVALANGGDGVVIKGGQLNTIGGTVEESGNVISGNDGNGVMLTDSGTEGNKVIGNFIGTNVTGFVALGNAGNGVFIRALASNNWIGGKSDGEGNLISGNMDYGVLITDIGSDSNTVAGNYIGTDITGTDSIPNNQGVGIWHSAKFNVIGTNGDGVSDSLERNIISGNSLNGVEISNSAEQNIVAGNLIGTDVTGTIAIPNAHGGNAAGVVIANGPKLNLIGTNNDGVSDELERNIISGNNGSGIDFFNSGGLNIIAGNYIGTDITGTDSLGNGLNGITLFGTSEDNQILKNLIAFNNEPAIRFLGQASGNIIGGDSVENGNTIFNNAGGIVLSSTVVNNQILFNTFSNNGDLAIDLNEDGITENDALDPDTGANNLQNFPVIESAYFSDCDSLVVVYTIDSDTVNSVYPLRVQFYASNGEKYIIEDDYTVQDFETGSKILNVGNVQNVVEGDSLISTATDADGNTSEFSSSIEVISKITELVTTSLTACDSPNGEVSASVNNITTGFTFEWWSGTDTSGASDFTGDTYSGIPAGTYTVIATDSISGCESTISIEVIDEIVIPAIDNTSVVNSSFCNKPNGSIEVTAVNPGVLADYSFTWYSGTVDPSNIVTNQTGSTLTDLAAGDYNVVATNSTSGCESAPVSLSINDDGCVVGFNSMENPSEIDLRVFPNPSDDDIIVKFDNQNREQFRIQIFDNRGRKTFEIKSNSNEQIEIPAYELKKGINILILTINNKSYPMRFLKN